MGQFALDTCTDVTGTTLTAHVGQLGTTWQKASGAGELVVYNDGTTSRLRSNSSGLAYYRSSAVPSSADYSVSVVVRRKTTTGLSYGLFGRLDYLGTNGYIALVVTDNTWQLFKVVSGSFTALGSYSQTLTANTDYTMTLDMSGTTIRLLVDSVERISVTDSAVAGPGTIGLWTNGSATDTTGFHLDQITATQSSGAPSFSADFALVFDGDSYITDYGRLGTTYISQLAGAATRLNTGIVWNFGVPGQTMAAATADAVAQIDSLFPLTAKQKNRVCLCLAGANDIGAGASSSTVLTRISDYHTARRAAGWKTVAFTLTKASSLTGANETTRQAVNAGLRASHAFADYLVDTDADPRFANTSNTTYFQADGVHFTVTGAGIVADLITQLLKPKFSLSAAFPAISAFPSVASFAASPTFQA